MLLGCVIVEKGWWVCVYLGEVAGGGRNFKNRWWVMVKNKGLKKGKFGLVEIV